MNKLIRLLLIAGASLMLTGIGYAYDCSTAAQYVDGSSYATGAIVQNNDHAYKCTVGGWCTVGGPYAPGTGWASQYAWSDLGACDTGGGNPPPSSGNPPPSSGNPPPSSGNPPPSSGNPPPSSGNPPPSSGNPPPSSGNPPPSSGGTGNGLSPNFLLAPYKDVTLGIDWGATNTFGSAVTGTRQTLIDAMPSGLNAVTLAFATGECGSDSWAGMPASALFPHNSNLFDQAGIYYIISTGGANGAFTCGSPSAFINFIQSYYTPHMAGVDFDIEYDQSKAIIDNLIDDVAAAQQEYPNMRFSFTLATFGSDTRAGSQFNATGDLVMQEIQAKGLTDYYINLMTMDYGSGASSDKCVVVNNSCDMGKSAIAAAKKLHQDYGIPYDHIEITPMIGGNDTQDETFNLGDVDEVAAFAKQVGLGGIMYWSFDRDRDCGAGAASSTCNSYGQAGTLGFANRFIADGLGNNSPGTGGHNPPPSSGGNNPPPSSGNPPPSSGGNNPPPSSGNPPPSSGGNSCDTAAQYVEGTSYATGDVVLNNGVLYQCTVGGWCSGNNSAYVPGSGWAWEYAWSKVGSCTSNPPPSSGRDNPPPSSGGNNPPPSSGGNNPPPSSGGNNPPPSSGNPPPTQAPDHLMIGYWHDFNNGSGIFRLKDVPNQWDVIIVAFATDVGSGTQEFRLDKALDEQQFIADIKTEQAKGKKVLISFGGAAGSVSMRNDTEVQNFVTSVTAMINKYGFDGIDLDLESGVSQGTAIQTNIVKAVKQLKQTFPNLFLTMAPEWPYVQGGYTTYGSIWGAYIPIINGLRDDLNVLQVQLYNNGGVISPYESGALPYPSEDMLVASIKMLVEGFPLSRGRDGNFAPLPASKVAIGLPSGPSAASSGYTQPAVVVRAIQCITSDTNCDTIHLSNPQPSFRGVMSWSINWDKHAGQNFSQTVAAEVHSLP